MKKHYEIECYKNCPHQNALRRRDLAFDWIDCPFVCKFGDDKWAAYKASGCDTVRDWYETEDYKRNWSDA